MPLWSPNGPSNTAPIPIAVCWHTAGWEPEKRVIMDALRGTWGRASPFGFAEGCPYSGKVDVYIYEGDGGSAGMGSWGAINVFLHIGRVPGYSVDRLRYLAVHEFGHVLGFQHEQDSELRPDDSCSIDSNGNVQQPWPGMIPLGPWDGRSIMNYCATGSLPEGFERFRRVPARVRKPHVDEGPVQEGVAIFIPRPPERPPKPWWKFWA